VVKFIGMQDNFYATRQHEKLKGMRNLAHQLTRTETSLVRKKRGLFNFIGQISHSLFGILDSANEEFFGQKMSQIGGTNGHNKVSNGTDGRSEVNP
jgi:hypothetical protein